ALRGPPPRLRGGVAQAPRREATAHGPELGRPPPPQRAGVVRPADESARRLRRDADLLLHPRLARLARPLHLAPAARGGVRVVLRGDDAALRVKRCRGRLQPARPVGRLKPAATPPPARGHGPRGRAAVPRLLLASI